MCTFIAGSPGILRSMTNAIPAVSQKVKFHTSEPSGPSVKTDIPGPKSLQRLAQLSRIQVQLLLLLGNRYFHFMFIS